MLVINNYKEMQKYSFELIAQKQKIGFVPTMGFLHEGHGSLIRKIREISDVVVLSIFVNPSQFAPGEDYERYPRNFERDKQIAEDNGCDIIFHPDPINMYPIGYGTEVKLKKLIKTFEGSSRPTHFDGVATVVAKLFNIVMPTYAIFGQKDYQQTLVVRQLAKDLNFPCEIIIAPTYREHDGLAMSSRNVYLSPDERLSASILFHSLEKARAAIMGGERNRKIINAIMHNSLRSLQGIRIDYASSANAESLEEPDIFLSGDKVVLLIAVYIGKTRLIDNLVVNVPAISTTLEDRFVEGV
ncbi:MAG: pantoate--beta-alanine ligase [Ignavibacteria bacterium]|nr:pantoate--beta-alanine ligase [Ignavibacteria bacterium]